MLQRRDFLSGSVGLGVAALAGGCATAPATESIRAVLKQRTGADDMVAGTLAIVVDESGTRIVTVGSSGVSNVSLDDETIFEIGSITKVLTALVLADMASRGEVGLDNPVAKYLPPSAKLNERGRPITLLDLATYTAGLPNMPGNLPPNWWTHPNPFADYTEDRLYAFLSSYMPKYEPGTHYEYANVGFALLGIALARRAGKSYDDLLIERVCNPLRLRHTRITLVPDMKKHLAQGHALNLKPTPLWDFSALRGAGAVRASAKDLTVFLKACMGFVQTPLRGSFTRLLETRRPTRLAGTDAGLGWFISTDESEELIWKSGLTGGFNTFVGFSTRSRRGALLLSNFLSEPLDVGTIELGMKLINPNFHTDLNLLYRPG